VTSHAERRRDTDRLNLAEALKRIRLDMPGAQLAHLETSDQDHYGFTLMTVIATDGAEMDVPEDTREAVDDLLCDLDWNGVVGETPQGYAVHEVGTRLTLVPAVAE
jgi:hypothetical protein